MTLSPIPYKDLNARQKENYNFLKVSAVLADYGFMTLRLTDDWQGADFIAQHVDGETFLKVQLKSRLSFDKKYRGKDLHIAFSHDNDWFLYPHDELLEQVLKLKGVEETISWVKQGQYTWPQIPKDLLELLKSYQIGQLA